MREIEIDGKQVKVRANPLALLYYKQEFKSDLMGDLAKLDGIEKDPSKFDALTFLRLTWVMAKTGSDKPANFPGFEAWLRSLDSFDFNDETMLGEIMAEAADGFFRGRSAGRGS